MTSTSATKTAEQARLADLFKLLTSRRPRSANPDNDASASDLRDAVIPEELEPVLKKLSSIVHARDAGTRPRRNTVASILAHQVGDIDTEDMTMSDEGSEYDEGTDAESLAKFPLGKEKKFTFKLMLYKLYKKDDWPRAVKEMLEKSKNEFKPLAEQEDLMCAEEKQEEETQTAKEGNVVKFKLPTGPAAGRRGSIVVGRQRSLSVATVGGRAQSTTAAPYPRSPYPRSPAGGEQPELRALKKRCVGRRKSMSGPLNAEAGKVRGTWVYNAAISASERPVLTTFSSFPPAPPPSPTSSGSFSKYQPLGMKNMFPPAPPPSPTGQGSFPKYAPLGTRNMPSTLQGSAGVKRRVSDGGPAIATMAPMLMPLEQVTTKHRLVARRRAMKVDRMDEDEAGWERKQAKRPFEG